MKISILRLGHRLPRDERITTHVALVARAFGASEIIYTGQHDGSLESSVSRLAKEWGGEFSIKYEKNYEKIINEYKKNGFVIVHLTMYGLPLPEIGSRLKADCSGLLIIVGGEQVPKEVYEIADFNIAITSQPHSEVAALAVFLDHVTNSEPLKRSFNDQFKGKIRIEPSERGKKIIKN
ncbi:tRNA (cytidine(56)-2'-O)-methyltransferase [Candidatus Micrarchaeota archaeon]|nr:tRNA (cytidine(56)-2'-O)-methyltransferase [Candidatus Micrarchaeota archaeon]